MKSEWNLEHEKRKKSVTTKQRFDKIYNVTDVGYHIFNHSINVFTDSLVGFEWKIKEMFTGANAFCYWSRALCSELK